MTSSSSSKASADVDYYRSLRGLNISVKKEISSAIERELAKDPFVDISSLLKDVESKYGHHRRKIEEDRKRTKGSETSFVASNSSSSSTPSTSTLTSSASPAPPPPTFGAIGSTSGASKPLFSFTNPSTSSTSADSAPKAASISEPVSKQVSTPAPAPAPMGTKPSSSSSSTSTSTKTESSGPTLPKAPTSGFSFAGASFDHPSRSTASGGELLPGQPTFSVPKGGFFSSFGTGKEEKEEGSRGEESDGGEESEEGNEEEKGEGEGEEENDGRNHGEKEKGDIRQPPLASSTFFTRPLAATTPSNPFTFGSATPQKPAFGSSSFTSFTTPLPPPSFFLFLSSFLFFPSKGNLLTTTKRKGTWLTDPTCVCKLESNRGNGRGV